MRAAVGGGARPKLRNRRHPPRPEWRIGRRTRGADDRSDSGNRRIGSAVPRSPFPKVAAIVDFYGITDVADLLDGPNERSYAVAWLGGAPDRQEVAKRVSPLTYVRPGLPPILTIQGDADPIVPYTHSLRLQDALEKAGVPHQLITVPGGKHGNFTADEYEKIYDGMRAFGKYNLPSQ